MALNLMEESGIENLYSLRESRENDIFSFSLRLCGYTCRLMVFAEISKIGVQIVVNNPSTSSIRLSKWRISSDIIRMIPSLVNGITPSNSIPLSYLS
jgi:hypothetical protein